MSVLSFVASSGVKGSCPVSSCVTSSHSGVPGPMCLMSVMCLLLSRSCSYGPRGPAGADAQELVDRVEADHSREERDDTQEPPERSRSDERHREDRKARHH